jgi:hypothetical protein
MKIPKEVKVSGIIYSVNVLKDMSNDLNGADYRGKVLFKENKILILDSYGSDDKFRTLLHEMIHIIDDDYNLDFKEETIRRMTTGLYQILKDNNFLKD